MERGTAKGINLKYYIDTAGKTGTSGGSKDKLFVGYTPYYTIGIWCGYDDGRTSLSLLEPSHLTIWDDIATEIHREEGLLDDPLGFSTSLLTPVLFSAETGKRVCDDCAQGESRVLLGYFLPYDLPMNCDCTEKKKEESIPA